jgi:hypothetical protein
VSAESVVLAGRQFAAARMTSTCEIRHETGRTFNEDTGEYAPTYVIVYTGPCKVRFESPRVFIRDMQSELLAEQRPILFLPIEGTEDVAPNDIATITAAPLDAALVGMEIRINGQHTQTYATARRMPCEVII